MGKENDGWFNRAVEKIKEWLIEIAILISAASVLVPYIIEKIKVLIVSINSLFN
jgi:hypothetical protein